jgi:hypothetical protein
MIGVVKAKKYYFVIDDAETKCDIGMKTHFDDLEILVKLYCQLLHYWLAMYMPKSRVPESGRCRQYVNLESPNSKGLQTKPLISRFDLR